MGGFFTWFCNTSGGCNLSKWLDRGLGNCAWRLAFLEAEVLVLNKIHSNHNPLLLKYSTNIHDGGNRPFYFHAFWNEHADYPTQVRDAWNMVQISVSDRPHKVRKMSLAFNRDVFGNVFRQKCHLEVRIKGVQRGLYINPTSDPLRLNKEM